MPATFFTTGFTTSRAQSMNSRTARFSSCPWCYGKVDRQNFERAAHRAEVHEGSRQKPDIPVGNKLLRRCTENDTTLVSAFSGREPKKQLRSWRATPSSMEPRATAPQRVRQGRFCTASAASACACEGLATP